VIEQTTNQQLPEDFQTAEFLMAHGMIDAIVPRAKLRYTEETEVHPGLLRCYRR
jgi:acetyl-CoA carboxylase beta subunit